jgi:hypothetical protein
MHQGIVRLPAFQPRTILLNVVIETSLGSTVKLKYDEETGVFRAHKAMPLGFCFPFNSKGANRQRLESFSSFGAGEGSRTFLQIFEPREESG